MAQTARTLTTASRLEIRCCLTALILISLAPAAFPSGTDPLRYQGGVRISPSRGPGKKQMLAVRKSLRQKTGLLELDFDSDGFLQLGDETQFRGGSQTARELLAGAIEGEIAFDLETHDHSRVVAFGRLGSPISFQSLKTGSRIEVMPIEIDFSDFDWLRGDGQAIASFDLGMVLLHEFAHGVLRLNDAVNEADGLGACEAHINQIRRELNLPERQSYFARVANRVSSNSGTTRPHAELSFVRAKSSPGPEGRNRREVLLLSWEADLVGQLRETISFRGRSGTVAMQ